MMDKIKWVLSTVAQVAFIIGILVVLVYVFTFDTRLDNRVTSLEQQPPPVIEAPAPEAEPVAVSPHKVHVEEIEESTGTPLSRIAQLIIRDEGVRAEPYLDSEGVVTIGIGRSLQTNGISVRELHAIVKDIDYYLLLTDTDVHKGRIKISRLSVAKRIFTQPLSAHDIELLLVDDLKQVKREAVSVFGTHWEQIDQVRQEAILDVLFNLGLPHFRAFKEFIKNVKIGNWKVAANELLRSEAAHQSPSRYFRNSEVIRTGDSKRFELY